MRRRPMTCGRHIVAGVAALAILTPAALAQTAPPPAPPQPEATAPKAAPGRSGPTQGKILFTIPEDGMGVEDMPASSRLVREVVAAHPNEDVIICIAGCRSTDRVVYAQPSDPTAAKRAEEAMQDGASAPVKPEITNKAAANEVGSPSSPPKPDAKDDQKAASQTGMSGSDAGKPAAEAAPAGTSAPAVSEAGKGEAQPRLVPTTALPKGSEAGSDAAAPKAPATPAATPAVDPKATP